MWYEADEKEREERGKEKGKEKKKRRKGGALREENSALVVGGYTPVQGLSPTCPHSVS